jgi:hypothetical protein
MTTRVQWVLEFRVVFIVFSGSKGVGNFLRVRGLLATMACHHHSGILAKAINDNTIVLHLNGEDHCYQ